MDITRYISAMSRDFLLQNWALAVSSVFALGILLFVLYRLYLDSGRGRLAERLRDLRQARGEAAAAATQLETAQQKLASLQRKAGSVKPRILAEADEAVQDADTMITITGDKVMRAEKQLRDVILEEFPPNRQDVLRNKYL